MGFPKGITKATSTGGTVTITAPNGPTTNFEVAAGSGGINQLTGDVTAGPGSGSKAATLVNTTNVKSIVEAVMSGAIIFGAGDPIVVNPVTPTAEGLFYVDTTGDSDAPYVSTGTSAGNWVQVQIGVPTVIQNGGDDVSASGAGLVTFTTGGDGSGFLAHAGTPAGVVTAAIVSEICFDTTNGALWIATATGTGGWVRLATLTSPAFTGTPTAPTATAGTNTTQLATTAFVAAAVALDLPLAGGTMSGAIAMGANKITGVANGSAAQDAAAFGQLATAGVVLAAPVVFTGSGTWTPSTTGSAIFRATIVGGGGGGGAGNSTQGGSGGGGGEVRDVYLGHVTGAQTVTIPAASGAGVAGGDVTIGALATAKGGALGGAAGSAGGIGGDGSGTSSPSPSVNGAGSYGGNGTTTSGTGDYGGAGVNRFSMGGGGGGGPTSAAGGKSGGPIGSTGSGGTGAALGGGGGGAGFAQAGTNGSAGVGGAGATASANTGAGGGGGGAGTTPGAGGPGGTGYVIIYQVA